MAEDQPKLSLDAAFEQWWLELPSKMKKAKLAARREWHKIAAGWPVSGENRAQDLLSSMVLAIRKQVAADHFRGTDGEQYTPHARTWLHQGRWEDEVEAPKRTVAKRSPEGNRVLSEHEKARLRRTDAAG